MNSRAKAMGERGTSLLEVVIAMFLLLVLMISILQMFSVAYVLNIHAAARTELTYKAQEVAEHIRYVNYLFDLTPPVLVANTGLTLPITDTGGPVDLIDSSGNLAFTYWGPGFANVIPQQNPQYDIQFTVTDPSPGNLAVPFQLTVTARGTTRDGARYLAGGQRKVVQYVTQLPK